MAFKKPTTKNVLTTSGQCALLFFAGVTFGRRCDAVEHSTWTGGAVIVLVAMFIAITLLVNVYTDNAKD